MGGAWCYISTAMYSMLTERHETGIWSLWDPYIINTVLHIVTHLSSNDRADWGFVLFCFVFSRLKNKQTKKTLTGLGIWVLIFILLILFFFHYFLTDICPYGSGEHPMIPKKKKQISDQNSLKAQKWEGKLYNKMHFDELAFWKVTNKTITEVDVSSCCFSPSVISEKSSCSDDKGINKSHDWDCPSSEEIILSFSPLTELRVFIQI